MARRVETKGNDPDEVVPLQIKMPLWLKRRGVARAKELGKSITDYVKDLIREDTGGGGKGERRKL